MYLCILFVLMFFLIFSNKLLNIQEHQDDGQAYLYILFVLMFYAFSIVVLMVKYIKREREGHRNHGLTAFNLTVQRLFPYHQFLYNSRC